MRAIVYEKYGPPRARAVSVKGVDFAGTPEHLSTDYAGTGVMEIKTITTCCK